MLHNDGLYTQYFNRTYKSDGQLFRGRYKSIVIDGDSYLLEVNKSKRRQAYIDFIKQKEPEKLRALHEKKKLPLLGANDFIDEIKQKYFDKTIIKEMRQVRWPGTKS